MGRGLGSLQKAILAIAHERSEQDPYAYVDAREVLIRHYRFPTSGKHLKEHKLSLVFDRRGIGCKRYMSANVTIAQCFNRLARKGLVERCYGHGVRLTRVGIRQVNEYRNSIFNYHK